MKSLHSLAQDESGAVATEYALMLALVTLGVVTALRGLGVGITDVFDTVTQALVDGPEG